MNDDDLKKLREGRVNIGPTTINAIIDEALFRGAQVRACEDVGVQVILLPDGRASVNNYRALRVEAELAAACLKLSQGRCVYCLATMPVEEAPAHVQSCPARLDLQEREIRGLGGTIEGLQHHLSAVLAERDKARAALAKAEQERDGMATELERKSKDLRAWEVDARTAQARLKELEAGTALTQAQTDVVTEAMRESQAALANARAVALEDCLRSVAAGRSAEETRALASSPPSGQWVAADVMEQVRNAIEQLAFGLDPEDFARPQDRYAAQLKISEDALKALFPDWNGPAMDEGRSMTRTGSELCAEIEALSSSLPSGHWVAADVMEKVKAALSEHSCDHCPGCEFPHGTSDEGDVAQLRAALSALESEASR